MEVSGDSPEAGERPRSSRADDGDVFGERVSYLGEGAVGAAHRDDRHTGLDDYDVARVSQSCEDGDVYVVVALKWVAAG